MTSGGGGGGGGVPEIPVGFSATGGPSTIVLTWDALTDVDGFHVYRDGSWLATINDGAETSYTDTPVTGTHTYHVRAFRLSDVSESDSATAPVYSDEVAVDSPLVWYKMDEASGALVNSGSLSGQDAAVGVAGTYRADGPGDAYAVQWAADSYYLAAGGVDLAPTQFSVEAWLYVTSIGKVAAAKYQQISGSPGDWSISVHGGTGALWGKIYQSESGAAYKEVLSGTALPLNEWVHGVMTYDDNYLRLYINGEAVGSSNAATATRQAASTVPLAIGRLRAGSPQTWTGRLAHVAVYGSALSPARIAAHYDATI